MSIPDSLQSMERTAYQRAYSDGIIDLFVGLSLMFIGAVWIWLPDYAALAGVLPAVFVPTAIATRKQYVEKRLGYVRWSEPRRAKERRNLVFLVGAGVVLLLGGVVAFLIVDRSFVDQAALDMIMPGLLAWLLALLAFGIAVLVNSWRFVLYGVVLAAAGVINGLQEANPGWPMLAAGVVAAVTGFVMLISFTRNNPIGEGE
jgi:hypothetical protein